VTENIIDTVTLKMVLFKLLRNTFKWRAINGHDMNKGAAGIIFVWQKSKIRTWFTHAIVPTLLLLNEWFPFFMICSVPLEVGGYKVHLKIILKKSVVVSTSELLS
jgi:hypothetical protein